MAEVFTVLEAGLAISEIIKKLYTYARGVKNAKDDIRTLTQELLALKAALDHFDLHSRQDLAPDLRSQADDVLALTTETLNGITARLERTKTSRLRDAVESAKWPFQAGEVRKHIQTIDRAKSWFIMVILRDSSDATGEVVEELRSLVQLVEHDILERREASLVKETGKMLRWLAPFDSRAQLEKATRGKTPGTGRWVLEDKAIRAWMDPESVGELHKPFVWISGKSGSGKTVLFSTIVDELSSICRQDSPPKRLLGYHCCSLDEAASQQLPNILGSILAAVGAVQPALLQQVSRRRHATPNLVPQNDLSLDEIKAVFDTVAASTSCLYVLVDAVNEAPGTRELLIDVLEELCREHTNLKILVTCTGEPTKTSDILQYRPMDSLQVDSDIHLYIQDRLNTERGFANLSPTMRQHILDKITIDAQGMFRWAKLCLDRLSVLRTGRDMRDALADMPRTLNDTYTNILDRIPDYDRPLARETLLWLCFSVRPLRLSELAEAVILREDDIVIYDDARLTNNATLLDICNGLVVRNGLFLTLAHDSVRSFLTGDHIKQTSAAYFAIDANQAHAHIMSRCLTYLRLSPFSSGPVNSLPLLRERQQQHPLLSYATTSWPIHSERFPLQASDEQQILDFFATKGQGTNESSFDSWVQFLLQETNPHNIQRSQPIYYAASFNMVAILRILTRPELGIDVDSRGGRFGSTPLFVAVWRQNWEAAELLLRAGADPLAWDAADTAYTLTAQRGATRVLALMDEMLEKRKEDERKRAAKEEQQRELVYRLHAR
ncbi:hypothetical protein NLU13_4886 [Sarocladium strictum]|uniref:Uncharacterized protein n=1 Tax=Sarocladium strictum TaxID=5046 RepID=A0AA39GJR2_SARSR|nr:hypothetical protein NLU13_4886 [Sarocladium strictum]